MIHSGVRIGCGSNFRQYHGERDREKLHNFKERAHSSDGTTFITRSVLSKGKEFWVVELANLVDRNTMSRDSKTFFYNRHD